MSAYFCFSRPPLTGFANFHIGSSLVCTAPGALAATFQLLKTAATWALGNNGGGRSAQSHRHSLWGLCSLEWENQVVLHRCCVTGFHLPSNVRPFFKQNQNGWKVQLLSLKKEWENYKKHHLQSPAISPLCVFKLRSSLSSACSSGSTHGREFLEDLGATAWQ